MTRYFRIDGRFDSGEPVEIFVKSDSFLEGWIDETDKVIEIAEKHGVDFSAMKSFNTPVEITETNFNHITDGQAITIKEYVAWADESGYYEPDSKRRK